MMAASPQTVLRQQPRANTARFTHPLYVALSVLGEAIIVVATLALLVPLRRAYPLDTFGTLLAFVALFWASTLLMHWLVRRTVPMRPGLHDAQRNRKLRWAWDFLAFLAIMNLHPLTMGTLLPALWRKVFYQLMGAKIGKGLVVIGGRIHDPYLVTIEENAIIGDDALLMPHAITANNQLLLAPIRIGRGAAIGARSTLMPGVQVAEGAMVEAASFVPAHTRVGPGEKWGGHPAVRIGAPRDNRS